jgi:acyl-CoA reductase-like NAD-dependent aldehyde dehydrogenase
MPEFMMTTSASIDWVSRAEALKLRVRNFVDGRWKDDRSVDRIEKRSPRDGRLLSTFGAGEAKDAEEAVASARRALEDGRWSKQSAQRRKDVLQNLAALMEQHREELALLECLDVGKPISDALAFDVPVAIATIRSAAETLDHAYGKVFGVDRSSLSYELRRPIGVVAGIVGWNFPLVLAATKVGPALATGNCLVLKPSELTSLSAARIAELAIEAGVPEGVFNVVHGTGAVGAALSLHRDVDLVTFTGSSATGKKLLIASGQSNMKRLILECGGKAPSIVFDDCPDIDAVAERVVARAFWNQGQVCTASSRLLIQESIKDAVLRQVIEKAAALKPGDPLNPHTRFGALVSREHKQKVQGYVDGGAKHGAQNVYQSASPPPFEDGFYVPPTIFDRVSPGQPLAQEEIFGPVLSVIAFRDEAEAIQIANNTIYGLSAIVWTKDMGRAHRVAQGIKAGWIVINATGEPAGGLSVGVKTSGGHKESGLGVEGGIGGLLAYTSHTAVQYFV